MPSISLGISLRGRANSAVFAPASLFAASEQGVWYDPSDLNTLFQDNTGLIPVTAVGQSVGKILDKSGRGNHATQAVPTQRPTYQIDGTGRPYLLFDGVDDGMVTNTITPAIDKVQVFAGVRKLSDAATGMIIETSVSVPANAGSILLRADASFPTYAFRTVGSLFAAALTTPPTYVSPITNVLTCISEIATDTALIRVNGAQVVSSSADQGTGNYLAYPLYIGRRGGTSVPLNGRIYSLITRFGPNLTDGQITSTESWVNGKTGAY
jgi:hypothetical protein